MIYTFPGIKKRLEQLKGAKDAVAYRGLKDLDHVISLELNEWPSGDEYKILMSYRRQARLALRSIVNK